MSVVRTKSGKWEARWREGSRQRSRTFERKSDAVRFDAEVKRRRALGALIPSRVGGTEFEELALEWINSRPLQESTARLYTWTLKTHILPTLGHMPITELTADHLFAWQQRRLQKGAGLRVMAQATALVKRILRHGLERELIQRNPAEFLKVPQVKRTERPVATPEQVEKLRRWFLDREDFGSATLISILAYGGLRPGEALGLHWTDQRENRVRVHRSVSYGKLKSTKTDRPRWVNLRPAVVSDLAQWKLACPLRSELVFPRYDGHPWSKDDWNNWRGRHFKKATTDAGLEAFRPYDLRHAAASLLIAEGGTIVEVAAQMGHSPKMCLDTYAHVVDLTHGRIEADEWIARARAA